MTPIHDHTVWGLVGVLRGAETSEEFDLDPTAGSLRSKGIHLLDAGRVDLVSPRIGDIHKVSNASADQGAISIHIYGANIGAVERHVYDESTAAKKPFVSGYSNEITPNIWDRSTGK
ncbi:MAG: putative metal-dependent enzyme (double-stranded beta helix superfamily) [Candidatus Latescibacterota bacterium]|jgi:predicted metal-dependent enzyme (double-stranded beta helix superfamily)